MWGVRSTVAGTGARWSWSAGCLVGRSMCRGECEKDQPMSCHRCYRCCSFFFFFFCFQSRHRCRKLQQLQRRAWQRAAEGIHHDVELSSCWLLHLLMKRFLEPEAVAGLGCCRVRCAPLPGEIQLSLLHVLHHKALRGDLGCALLCCCLLVWSRGEMFQHC